MVYELHIAPSEAEVGYYAGLIESLFAFTQFLTVLWWGRLSDRIGRRPVLLAGLVGVSLSTLAFGLADGLAPGNGTIGFVLVLLARGATGATNGNVAAVKSMVGEMTDESNQARAFSLLPLVYAIGQTIGLV